jgi:hypothetical protein
MNDNQGDMLSFAASLALIEAREAELKFGPMTSPHQGYALILEELDELWDHVKQKEGKRDLNRMRDEAIQVAAMALCFVADLCGEDNAV